MKNIWWDTFDERYLTGGIGGTLGGIFGKETLNFWSFGRFSRRRIRGYDKKTKVMIRSIPLYCTLYHSTHMYTYAHRYRHIHTDIPMRSHVSSSHHHPVYHLLSSHPIPSHFIRPLLHPSQENSKPWTAPPWLPLTINFSKTSKSASASRALCRALTPPRAIACAHAATSCFTPDPSS